MLTISLLIVLPAAAWRAYVMSVLWTWFVTPVFGVASPSIWILAGLAVFIAMFSNWNVKPFIDQEKSIGEKTAISVTMALAAPAFCLLAGWIFHLLAGVA